MHIGSPALIIAFAFLLHGVAQAQWIHFQDRSASRLAIAAEPDDREKDCAAGDFDRDGWDDIVVVRKAPFKTPGGAEDILLMNRAGTLTDETANFAPEFLTNLTDARDVFVTDIDGDQWPDLILANTFGQQPVCYRNQGEDQSGNWLGFADESATRLPVLSIPALQFCAVCAQDITGDGSPEIYFSNYVRAPDIALDVLLLNDGSGHFTDASDARLGLLRQSAFGTSVDLRDMDNDGDLDIIKTSSLNSVPPWNEVGVFILFNDGSGHFDSFQSVPTESPYMFAVDDLNNDEMLDLYIVNDSQDFTVLHAGVDEARPDPVMFDKTVLQDSPRTTFLGGNLQCRDLDNDGDLDVAIADVDIDIGICETAPDSPRKFALLRNEGSASGTLADPWGAEANPWNINVFDLCVLDIDRDGRLDIFLAGCSDYSVWMQEHTLHVSTEAIFFDGTLAGASEESTLRICNNGPDPIDISAISTSDPHFSLSDTTFPLAAYECREIVVTFAPPAPGDYSASLQISGDFSREVALGALSLTPPEAAVDLAALDVQLHEGAEATHPFSLSNLGGSELEFQISVEVPGLAPDRVLLMGDDSALPLVEDRLLQSLPNEFSRIDVEQLTTADVENYDTLALALTSGSVSADNMQVLSDAVRSGKTLVIIGATTDPDFLAGLQDGLLSHTDEPGWQAPASPHFQIADRNHPLANGLPATHDFSLPSSSWYRIQPNDPDAWVAANNGDGVPCLVSKQVEQGLLVYFTNWPLSFSWDNPVDRPVFGTIVSNAIGSAKTSWISVNPRDEIIPAGGAIGIDIALNTNGQAPGHYRANLIITTNDPSIPELVIPIDLEITADLAFGLELNSVEDGQVLISLRGDAGITYQIQRSTDLISWQPVREVQAEAGAVIFVDSPAPPAERVYYRAAQP